MKKQSLNPSEHSIQTQIINYLKYKGWYVQRLNSGRMPYEYKGRKGFMMLAEKGTPDIFAFRKGTTIAGKFKQVRLLFIEVKREGNKPTLAQQHKMEELSEKGAVCLVATSIEDVQEQGY